jgi:hypothetical protein
MDDVLHISIVVSDLPLLLDLPELTKLEIDEGINDFVRNYFYCEKSNG